MILFVFLMFLPSSLSWKIIAYMFKYVLSTMGVSKESISKFLIGNRFHVKLRILSPYSHVVAHYACVCVCAVHKNDQMCSFILMPVIPLGRVVGVAALRGPEIPRTNSNLG